MIPTKLNFSIALLFSLLACSSCHNQLIALNSLEIRLFSPYNQYIKNANVYIIESDGKKNKGKYDRSRKEYCFSKINKKGTLIIKHWNYQQETYQLEDILNYYVSSSITIVLGKKRHGYYSSGNIRYPYIKQPNRFGLAILDYEKGKLLADELIKEGFVSSNVILEKKEKRRRKNHIVLGETSFDIQVYKIPEKLDSIARSRISKLLFSYNQSIPNGPLVGGLILQREITLVPLHPKTSEEIRELIESKAIPFSIESVDQNQYKIRLHSFSAEEIIQWSNAINETKQFYMIPVGLVSPVFYHR